MRNKYLLFVTVVIVLFSCKKENETTTHSTPPPDPPIPVMLLKSIVIPNLPSPYYFFEYDTTGRITLASFASGLNTYAVTHDQNRIINMLNNTGASPGLLEYFYNDKGQVNRITYKDPLGILQMRFSFSYDYGMLVKVERERRAGSDLVLNKIITMTYYADSNLQEITYHYPKIDGFQNEASVTDRFEHYDNKINVDDFSLLHNDFFDQLVLLPGVKLQKNNPGREIQTGDGDNLAVTYAYTYNDKLFPLTKAGEITVTSGTHAGEIFQTNSVYTYY